MFDHRLRDELMLGLVDELTALLAPDPRIGNLRIAGRVGGRSRCIVRRGAGRDQGGGRSWFRRGPGMSALARTSISSSTRVSRDVEPGGHSDEQLLVQSICGLQPAASRRVGTESIRCGLATSSLPGRARL
jgi:hypothetical protein